MEQARLVGFERLATAAVLTAFAVLPAAICAVALMLPHDGPGLVFAVAAATLAALATAVAYARRRDGGPLLRLAARLPPVLDGGCRRHPVLALLWTLAVLVALFQIVRLSAFMTDPRLRFGAAFPPAEWATRHICQAAYVHAADLARRSEPNLYAEQHYPAFREPGAAETPVVSGVANLAANLSDAYEYPPPFLLLPRLGLVFSNDFLTLRTAWFGLQAAAFQLFAAGLAAWIAGRRGARAALLLPLLWLSLPMLFNFQFGQAHLASVAAAVGGMLAFAGQRYALGGALLGAAVVSKLFPGLLVVTLAAQRRWRELSWTAGFCLGYAALGVVVLGWAPYQAFFEYHLPRMLSGEAFAFFLRNEVVVASNWSIYGIPFKLQRLGVPGLGADVARWSSSIFTLVLLATAAWAGLRRVPREQQPGVWLGLLALGSLRSPLAPNAYVAVPALWLLTLLAGEWRGLWAGLAVTVAWIALGSVPPAASPQGTIVLWMVGQVLMLALGFWVVLRRPRPSEEVTAG